MPVLLLLVLHITGGAIMRVTTKGQVTIPQEIREKLGITPAVEIDFIEEKGRVYLVKKTGPPKRTTQFSKLRGIATVKMTTDEIMALTRGA
jgi:AbrB family looped-hinge helix DNA binding protein